MRAKPLNEAALFEYALKILGARAITSGELKVKLRRRAERLADVDPILSKLKDYGYLNDKKFAENYAARRLENEGLGRMKVLSDLRAKRVAPAVAERAVGEAYAESDEVALIERFLARKYRRQPISVVISDVKGMASAFRKLRAAGFSGGNALSVLKRHAKDAAAAEALETLESSEDLTSGENSGEL